MTYRVVNSPLLYVALALVNLRFLVPYMRAGDWSALIVFVPSASFGYCLGLAFTLWVSRR